MSMYFGAMCDEFLVTTRLHLKLGLPDNRETLLHFFDRLAKEFPSMDRLRRRNDGGLVLESDPEEARQMWVRLDTTCLRFGQTNPQDVASTRRLAEAVFEHAPYHLSLTHLDIDRMEQVYSFDLDFVGNHDQLVAETLYAEHPLSALTNSDQALHVIECQPCIGIALSPNCEQQAYVELRSRSTTYEASRGQFDARPLTVSLIMRQYWSSSRQRDLMTTHDALAEHAEGLATDHVVPLIVNPLAHAIASRP